MSATGEVIALSLTLGVHILGAVTLIAVLVRGSGAELRDWWPDDDDGGPPRGEPDRPAPPRNGGGGLPLPGAEPSPVRLREPGTIAGGYPRRERRPAHAPSPSRTPARR